MPDAYEIWTDGGCINAHVIRPGGWAWCLVKAGDYNNIIGWDQGNQRETTNNRMELEAVRQALLYLRDHPLEPGSRTLVYSDSKYVVTGITKWVHGWRRNRWIMSAGTPVKNRDLWQEVDDLRLEVSVGWRWVRGHNGEQLNEMVDQMCAQEIDRLLEVEGYQRNMLHRGG